MSATLRLERSVRGIGFELWRRPFSVTVDGKDIASVEVNGRVEAPVEPGEHTLQIRAGRYTSRSLSFDVPDHDIVSFRCYGAMLWPRFVASLIVPSLAISLYQV